MGQPLSILASATLRLTAAALLVSLPIAETAACELCIQAANKRLNLVDQLASADRVVLARPEGENGQLRIVLSIKGDEHAGNLLIDPIRPLYDLPFREPFAAVVDRSRNDPLLLVGDTFHPGWTGLGTISEQNADWLRALAATVPSPSIDPRALAQSLEPAAIDAPEESWRERVVRALPHLGGRQRTVERELAWSEIVRAPYGTLAVVVGRLPGAQVAEWLGDPAFASHLGGVLHLYGYVGGREGASRIRERLMQAAEAHEATALGPLMVADLELEGTSVLNWIESTYFADRSRSLLEIQAALFALKVQGQADRAIPRSQVIAALRRFIALRPAMADAVAITLASWNYWGAQGDYKAILASGVMVDPASEFTVTQYLRRASAAAQSSNR